MNRFFAKLLLLIAGVSLCTVSVAEGQGTRPLVKIGMLKSMFRDVKPGVFSALSGTFSGLVESQTGMKGELTQVDSPDDMRQKVMNGELQLGAFHGFEFAWMKLKEPDLQPLMLAAVNPGSLKAVVVVAKDCQCNSVEQLQGKTVAIPTSTREHSRLYISRQCRRCGRRMEEHFAEIPTPKTVEDALDDVVDGVSCAAVTDMASLQTYERRKPGRYAKLKIVQTSEAFPASVIAYKTGGLTPLELQRFQDGMATAHKSLYGSQLMGLMKIQQFEPVPGNYDQVMAEILKAYPPPWVVTQR
ncbi:MAG: phosphate/phosphite/phosphonate ABC transporter substrate-binding protein [Gemmataceae bacterium]